jgi:NADH:ubiquinone oxidoreductase subunit 3 (subunit A)
MEYIGIGILVLIIILAVVSTVRFNKKKPMTREEYEAYEKEKKEWKEQ